MAESHAFLKCCKYEKGSTERPEMKRKVFEGRMQRRLVVGVDVRPVDMRSDGISYIGKQNHFSMFAISYCVAQLPMQSAIFVTIYSNFTTMI